ncbi:3-deoxy-manno-octulosonate cytidylyltransferase, partial [Francisella tularensis subsp. holarctica]|nr:3-deoxy-manno-octulosonate cytidylyltransferase [Francisella tularensis subsp. holarctica]
ISEFFRTIGIYAYRVDFLKISAYLTVSPIEKFEALEHLRFLYNGYKIAIEQSDKSTPAVFDTLQDLEKVWKLFNV